MWTIQSNFSKGELDPQAKGRIDLNSYYQGMQTAKNVLCIPQGGVKKRSGTLYFDESTENTEFVRLEAFSFDTDNNYLIAFRVGNPSIAYNRSDDTTQNITGLPWSEAEIAEFDYIQSYDTIIITHPNHEPIRIKRESNGTFTTTNMITANLITNVPEYNFGDVAGSTNLYPNPNPTGSYPNREVQVVTFNAGWADGDTYKITFNGIETDPITYKGFSDVTEATESTDELIRALRLLPNLSDNIGIAVAPAAGVRSIAVSFGEDSANEWQLISGLVESAPDPTNNKITVSRTNAGTSLFEPVWSVTRGYPATCTFHENRLWFGGSQSLPSTLWGSNVNDYFNFRSYKARDDEAVIATLDTDQRNAITGVISNRTLQVFTTGQEFYVPESPITPSNVAVAPQTNFGSKRVRPVNLSGQTLFIQRTGKSLNGFVYTEEQAANTTTSVSILAPHLIKDPVKLSIQRGTDESDANYIYIVNSDGTATVLNSLPSENITAFTQWITDGNIKNVSVLGNELFWLVERNGKNYIELTDSVVNTDNATFTGFETTVTGLERFNGETVNIKTDGYFYGTDVVTGGQVTLDEQKTVIEIGLPFVPEVETMPLNLNLQTGSALYKKKKIKRVGLEIYESNGIIVNNNRIADKTIGVNQFSAPSPQSGLKRVYTRGWGIERTVTITQDTPFDFQILAIGVEVAL